MSSTLMIACPASFTKASLDAVAFAWSTYVTSPAACISFNSHVRLIQRDRAHTIGQVIIVSVKLPSIEEVGTGVLLDKVVRCMCWCSCEKSGCQRDG